MAFYAVCLKAIIRKSKIKIPSIAYSHYDLDVDTIRLEFVHLMCNNQRSIPHTVPKLGVRTHIS